MNSSLNNSCLKKHKQTICHNLKTCLSTPVKGGFIAVLSLLGTMVVHGQSGKKDSLPLIAGKQQVIAENTVEATGENAVVVDTAVKITLADGVQLNGILAYPRQQGPFPVILKISCYPYENKQYDRNRCKAWADSGYAAMVVFVRGKEHSGGVFYPFENDAADNYEVIDWISRQHWCNGKVGMYGGSYLGFSQWAAAKKLHPALKTIVPQAAVAPGVDYPVRNGVFTTYPLQWLKFVRNRAYLDTVQMNDVQRWKRLAANHLLKGAAFNRFDATEGHYDTVFQRWLAHPAADSFWQRMIPGKEEFAGINIPILTTTGYFDGDQRGLYTIITCISNTLVKRRQQSIIC